MVHYGLRAHLWVAWSLFYAPLVLCAHNSTAAESPSQPPTSTCESRSINYVTHSLPQQCLNSITRYTSAAPTSSGGDTATSSAASTPASDVITVVETRIPASVPGTSPLTSEATSADSPSDLRSAESRVITSDTHDTASPLASASVVEVNPAEAETDSLLDNAKFLSFEEWKKENLAQAGQSAENLQHVYGADSHGKDRKRPGINHALDSLGEDSEIEIDFSGFGGTPSGASQSQGQGTSSHGADPPATTPEGVPAGARTRSKDAGKTCKERFNYASFDCAANVLKTNPQCKSSSSILVENKDSYMLNECSADNKFLIVELCNDILVDTVVLANFEFFSSMFRVFRISVSDKYPVKIDKWKELGTFEARNSREIQAFLIENPLIWARYLRVEFLTHFGNEYYCPVSLLRVHGTTMMEEYREEQKKAQGIDPDEDDVEEDEASAVKNTNVNTASSTGRASNVEQEKVSAEPGSQPAATPTSMCFKVDSAFALFAVAPTDNASCKVVESPTSPSPVTIAVTTTASENIAEHTITDSSATSLQRIPQVDTPSTVSVTPNSTETVASGGSGVAQTVGEDSATPSSVSPSVVKVITASSATSASQGAIATSVSPPPNQPPPSHAPPAPAPPTQESFFKSINKRLSFLEANATLSLQYIESQSQLLREAFGKVEKRNIAKISEFLNALNSTVLMELTRYKAEYEQVWQSTVLELSSQREESRRERELMGERIRVLAEEMVGQKRLMAVQATLLLLCLVLVVFGKFSAADVSWMQSMQGLVRRSRPGSRTRKGAATKPYMWDSPWGSPPRGGGSPRPGSAGREDRDLPRMNRAYTSPNPHEVGVDRSRDDEQPSNQSHQRNGENSMDEGSADESGDETIDAGQG